MILSFLTLQIVS